MRKCRTAVIQSAASDLVFSATCEDKIPRLHLGIKVTTQPPGVAENNSAGQG